MAKIGTAHVEIKPVLNEEALAAIVQRIEDAVAEAVSASNPCAHENVRTFRATASGPSMIAVPYANCLDCGLNVEKRWVAIP